MVFTLFRIILLFTEFKQLEILPHKYALIANAFFMGWRFDTVISGYILFFPLLFLSIFSFFNGSKKLLYNIIHYFIFIFFSLAFALCALDIPYFNYYFSRLTIVILSWTDNAAFGFKMIFEETSYFIYFIVFLIVCFLFYISIKKIKKIIVSNSSSIGNKKINFYISHLLFSLLALAIMFLGIRGRIEKKSPIKVGTAYFSNYAFPNQLGLNPVFTFIQSYIDKLNPENASLHLMDNGLAIKITNTNLGIKNNQIPFERLVEAKSNQPNANIVLVIMESMSAGKMKRFGNTKNLTPFLDSIANVGLCFNNIYSAGIHTFNGIFSTLFSYPALLKQHPMNATEIPI